MDSWDFDNAHSDATEPFAIHSNGNRQAASVLTVEVPMPPAMQLSPPLTVAEAAEAEAKCVEAEKEAWAASRVAAEAHVEARVDRVAAEAAERAAAERAAVAFEAAMATRAAAERAAAERAAAERVAAQQAAAERVEAQQAAVDAEGVEAEEIQEVGARAPTSSSALTSSSMPGGKKRRCRGLVVSEALSWFPSMCAEICAKWPDDEAVHAILDTVSLAAKGRKGERMEQRLSSACLCPEGDFKRPTDHCCAAHDKIDLGEGKVLHFCFGPACKRFRKPGTVGRRTCAACAGPEARAARAAKRQREEAGN